MGIVLIFVNILIAIFSEIWMNIKKRSRRYQAILYWDVISEESYSLPFAILNPMVQVMFLIWVFPATIIALMKYFIRNGCSQIEEEADKKLKEEFWKALGVFIRLKIFPRIRQDNTCYLSEIRSDQIEENGPISSMKFPTSSLNQAEPDDIIITTTTITPTPKMTESATVEQECSSKSENYSSVFDDSSNSLTMTTQIPSRQSAAENTPKVSPTTITPTTKTMIESATVEQNGLSMPETDNSFNDSSVIEDSNNPSTTM